MFFSPSAFVAAGVFNNCWDLAAGPAGLRGGLSGLQEKTTSQSARSPRPNSLSVLITTHSA